MTGVEYQGLAARTMNPKLNNSQWTNHALLGMASEAGEICGLYQKAYKGHPVDKEHAMKELGDLMWFVAEWCTANNVSLDEIMQLNIDKLRARYPDGFSEQMSLHRREGDV